MVGVVHVCVHNASHFLVLVKRQDRRYSYGNNKKKEKDVRLQEAGT